MNRAIRALLGLLVLVTAGAADAQQVVEAGGYRVNYAALNTMQLSPEIARRYGVKRRGDRALLLLNVRRDGKAVPASGRGTARGLTGHTEKLELRQVRVDDSYDLIAEFEILDGEFLHVEAQVLPAGGSTPIAVKFRQQYYRE
ncbi:MAG TPA: DUF4426 domain-containing protein [Solimonas sp.]|nr:DUF4426 domain-containing protein [Solimonas sp.]